MRCVARSCGFIFLFGWLASAYAQSPVCIQIQTTAKKVGADMVSEHYADLVDLMYPKVTEMAGGRDKMVAFLKDSTQQMHREGFKFDSVDIGQPSEPVPGGDKLFSVLSQTVHVTTPEGKGSRTSYLLAISADKGKTWTFLDGSGINPQVLKTLFPEFPPSVILPDQQPSKFSPTS